MPQGAPAAVEQSLREDRRQLSPLRIAAVALALACVALVLWGGYGRRWPWTGINGSTATLWDWLHLLLLPAAFGLLPVLISARTRMRRQHRWGAIVAIVVLLVLVVAGYTVPWSWTGFSGNKLWDWLELLALPFAVALVPAMDEIRRRWSSQHSLAAAVVLAAFVVVVIEGYVGHWAWTGFRGNTLWNWLHLLLLPLLLPTLVVPSLRPRLEAALIRTDGAETATNPAGDDWVEADDQGAGEDAQPLPPAGLGSEQAGGGRQP
jgi:putative effector of murein hydrolase LrgA (UPF0299 family)